MNNAQPNGFLALPTNGNDIPVLVLHAWWGLNETTKAYCSRLADEGFAAFAPDLYDGTVVDTIADAEQMSSALDADTARGHIATAAKFLIELARSIEVLR